MDRKGESSPADPRLSMRGQVPVCQQASSFASHKLVRRATKNTAERLSCLQQGCKVCGAESMCLETFTAQRPAVRRRRRRGGMAVEFLRPHGCPCHGWPANFPVAARAPSSPAAPRHRKSPAEGTACAKAGLALGKNGAFPERIKSSKTLSCQFEEAYAFCKFLES